MSIPSPEYRWFVGIDWGREKHQVCVLAAAGGRRSEREIEHSPAGFTRLLTWLRDLSGNELGQVVAAIETPVHPVVDSLLDAGVAVHALNPKQLDRFRDRHSVAGAKDDRLDAFVLANSLRTDRELFRELAVPDPATAALRVAHRTYHTLREDLGRHANRLGELLVAYAPTILHIDHGADDRCFWELLSVGLDPNKARTLRLRSVEAILTRHRKRSLVAADVLAALRAPRLTLRDGVAPELLLEAGHLVAILRVTLDALKAAERRVEELVKECGFEAEAVDSLPGAATVVTAAFLAEAHDALARRDLNALRARCGTAPVTRQSGKSRHVGFRRACNPYLRNACWDMARTAIRTDPWAKELYTTMRARGLSFDRALRGVADRLLTRLVALLRTQTRYVPQLNRPLSQDPLAQ